MNKLTTLSSYISLLFISKIHVDVSMIFSPAAL